MKPIFFILCFFTCADIEAQVSSSLKVNSKDCRSNEVSPSPWIKLYKLPEDTLSYTININRERNFPVLWNFIPGHYRVQYYDMYGQLANATYALTNCEASELTICADELSSYPQHSLKTLEDGDSIVVHFASIGCFHSSSDKLVISKAGTDNYQASLYKRTRRNSFVRSSKPDTLTTTLTPKNISDFIRFENELNFVTRGGCTSVDSYTISSKNLNKKAIDGSCRWSGFSRLCMSFFGQRWMF